MNEPNIEKDFVFSEMVFVKREILDSYFNAVKKLGRITRKKMMNSQDKRGQMAFIMFTYNMFQKMRPFFDEKKVKEENMEVIKEYITKIDESMTGKKRLTFQDWYKVFLALQGILYDLGIYKIGFTKIEPPRLLMKGLTDG